MDEATLQGAPAPLSEPAVHPTPTHFSDVCGSIDALEQALYESPEVVVTAPRTLEALVDDALSMGARMEQRLGEYEAFRAEIVALAAVLGEIGGSRRAQAVQAAALLRPYLRRGRPLDEAERAEVERLAEEIRAVAQDLENSLYRYKDLALALARSYRAIQGNRSWVLDDEEAQASAPLPGEPGWARWLPSSPHRERILRYLRVGRAHLVPVPGDGAPPLVQFEDGGLIPLPTVRWSEDVRNFYPAGSPPHPNGLRYREKGEASHGSDSQSI